MPIMQEDACVLIFILLTAVPLLGNFLELTLEDMPMKHEDDVSYLEHPVLRRLVHLANSQRRSGKAKETPVAIDLMIALDGTAVRQGSHHFKLQKKIASLAVSEFSISPSGTRISLLSLSHRPSTYFDFKTFVNKECTIRAINDIRPTNGRQFNYNHRQNFLTTISRGWRKKALKILFVFVNKGHVFGSKVVDFLTRRFGNLEVFVMAVGAGIGIDSAVRKWASRPFELHFIGANNYYALKKEFSVIEYKGVNKRCDLQTRYYYDECARLCVCEDGKSTHCYRVRKEFTTMPLEERIRFIETIKQANLDPKYREEFSRLTDIHSEQFFHGVHERDFFLPWHRWYLFEFENFLRQIDCRVTIPYWDWARVSKTFWRESHERDVWNSGPHGLGGNGRLAEDYCVMVGPFRKGHWLQSKNSGSGCLKRRFKYDKQPRNTTDIRKTVDSSFKVFEHNVRKVFHNELHCLIGGTMGNITSSQSPEFWLHHAFLDQIWVQYQRRGDQQRNEYYPYVNGTLPGCRIKWRPGNFVQETNLPGCVRILYKENKDHKEDQMDAKTESYYNESIKYKETVCFHDRKIE